MATKLRLKLPSSYSFAISADGNLVAAIGRNVVVANARTLRKVSSSHPVSHPYQACFNNDGTLLAVKNTSGRIVVLRANDSELLFDHLNQSEGEGSSLHFSPCGKFLIDGSWTGHVSVREVLAANVVSRFDFAGEMITEVSPSADSQHWLITHQPRTLSGSNSRDPAYMTLWQWPLTKPKSTIRPSLAQIQYCKLSPDGKRIALVGYDESLGQKMLQVLGISGEELFRTSIDIGGTGAALRWSPDGALIGSVQRGRIAVYASAGLHEVSSYTLEYPSDICFSSDGSFIALGTWSYGLIEQVKTMASNLPLRSTMQSGRS